jgi:DNA-binding MltR family transcriptional regulator
MSKIAGLRYRLFREPINEMFFNESDRGCVLVGASMIDEQLTLTLKAILSHERRIVDQSISNLFRVNGPFSSYWSKVHILNALGLLSSDDFADLEAIRQLRNEVAHGGSPFDFESVKVSGIVNQLNCWRRHFVASSGGLPPELVEEQARKRKKAEKAGTRLLAEAKLLEEGIWKMEKLGFASTVWELLEALKELPKHRKARGKLHQKGT